MYKLKNKNFLKLKLICTHITYYLFFIQAIIAFSAFHLFKFETSKLFCEKNCITVCLIYCSKNSFVINLTHFC